MNNTGGPAFPRNILDHGHGVKTTHESGMTMRDYFAAKAMQSLLLTYAREIENGGRGFDVCPRAYRIADEMLKARAA